MFFEALLLSILVAGGPSDVALRGAVRDGETGGPVENVLVEVLDEPRHAWSDSLGGYELPLQALGAHRVRFSRLGYETLEVEVFVSDDGALRLDASLSPRPIALGSVRVTAQKVDARDAVRPALEAAPEIGSRRFAPGDSRLGRTFRGPDALGVLAASPDVVVREDAPTALHVRGGSADENAVFLDGLPVLGPYHAGGALSAVSPDVVADVRLHAGVAPARLGGGLSSAIEIQTRSVPRDGFATRGALTPRGARASLSHGLPGGVGGVLVSGRRSYRPGLLGDEDSAAGKFGDVLIKGTTDLPGGTIDVLSFRSHDRAAFDAFIDPEDLIEGSPLEDAGAQDENAVQADGVAETSAFLETDVRNRFDWESGVLGLVWRQAWENQVRTELRAWRSGFEAELDWRADGAPLRLNSARTAVGVEGAVAGPFAAGQANAGLRLERTRVRYRIASSDPLADLATTESLLALESAPTVLTAYAEDAWSLGDRWALRAGLRGRAGTVRGPGFEPRVSLAFTPRSGLVLSAGYARTLQDIQSLRNEESILDAVVGIDLPAAAEARRMPAAHSDQLTAAVEAWLGGTRVALEGYARRLEGLVLVAPSTSQPFALDGFETGRGEAAGATLLIERRGPRLSSRAAFALGRATRGTRQMAYHSGSERGRSVAVALDYRLAKGTRVGTTFLAASGGPTSPVSGPFIWEPLNAFGGEGDIEGSPQRIQGPLNDERLPSYARWDLGLRHEWSGPWSGEGAVLATYLDVANVLDRRNALGYVLESDADVRRPFSTLPRSVTFGLEWRY